MKKTWIVLLTAAALVLPGCGSGARSAAASSGGEAHSAARVGYADSAAQPARELADEEVLTAYARAVRAWEWFELAPLPGGGPVLELDGAEYQRVDYPGMGSLEELESYLRSLFSQEAVDRLLAGDDPAPRYRDVEGELYVRLGGRDADPAKGEIAVSVEHPDAQTYLVDVTVELLEDDLATAAGVECYSFPYGWVDGRWVFTEFQLVY